MIMKLPNLSESMYVARLRHIQSIHEASERRNPDTLVRHFLPVRQRLRAAWLGRQALAKMRAEPFYHYLIARTKHYDAVLTDAIADGAKRVIIVGCGSDTRAYRFASLLRSQRVSLLECDQPAAIGIKREMTKRWRKALPVEYLPIDLNDDSWPDLQKWIAATDSRVLVLIEGVSPYIDEQAFPNFLRLLATALPRGSHVAYDFKIRGVSDNEGLGGRTRKPFRLSASRNEAVTFHEALGFHVRSFEMSDALTVRLVPQVRESGAPLFEQDGLVRLLVPSTDAAR